MKAMTLCRIAHSLYKKHVPILPKIFYRLIYLINNCHVHYQTEIGTGTVLAYGGVSVIIHKDAVIGENCVIESNVTIGGRNNSIIGANAVVIHDVPDNCSVAGVPARILHENINIDDKCNLRDITQRE